MSELIKSAAEVLVLVTELRCELDKAKAENLERTADYDRTVEMMRRNELIKFEAMKDRERLREKHSALIDGLHRIYGNRYRADAKYLEREINMLLDNDVASSAKDESK